MLPLGDFDGQHIPVKFVGDVDGLTQVFDGIRYEVAGYQRRDSARGDFCDARVDCLENVEFGYLEGLDVFRKGLGVGEHHGCALLPGKRLRAERPSGSDDKVAGHADLFRFVEDNLKHINPFVAEPNKLFGAGFVSAREAHGVDFNASDSGLFEKVELPDQFVRLHAVSVPPPADEGTVPAVRILELLEMSVWGGIGCQAEGQQHGGAYNDSFE